MVAEVIKKTAFQVTRMGQMVAQEASKRLNVPFGIVDLSLAPTPAMGDSVAHILEEMGLERTGQHGTTAALALAGLLGHHLDVYKRQPLKFRPGREATGRANNRLYSFDYMHKTVFRQGKLPHLFFKNRPNLNRSQDSVKS